MAAERPHFSGEEVGAEHHIRMSRETLASGQPAAFRRRMSATHLSEILMSTLANSP